MKLEYSFTFLIEFFVDDVDLDRLHKQKPTMQRPNTIKNKYIKRLNQIPLIDAAKL